MKKLVLSVIKTYHETKIIKSVKQSGAINRLTEHSSETDQTLYNNLIYDKKGTSYQWRIVRLFIIGEGKTDSRNLKTTGSLFQNCIKS